MNDVDDDVGGEDDGYDADAHAADDDGAFSYPKHSRRGDEDE